VDARGELIGINTFLISSNGSFSGMGFAIPAQIVQPTVEALIRDGKISHGYIGIGIADVTPDNAKFFQMNNASGAVVSQVEANSPGGKAGLKTGDVIVKLNGQTVTDAGELQMEVGQKRPGDTIQLEVLRDGKTETIPVTLEAMSKSANGATAESEHGKGRWGLSLGDLEQGDRDQIQVPNDVHGAVVEDVQPGSPADNAGLQRGDVITEVNRHSTQSATDVAHALSSIAKGQDALVLVWSNGGSTFRVLHPSQE
jgi:serine protease Do